MVKLLQIVFAYLKSRSPLRLLVDAIIVASLVTWICAVTVVSTNFGTFKDLIEPPAKVDIRHAYAVDSNINAQLAKLRETTGADRAVLNRFHNGKRDLSGIHFIYLSRTGEQDATGVSNEIVKNQNLPLSLFTPSMAKLLDGSCYRIETSGTGLEVFYKEQGIKSVLLCPVFRLAGDLVGTLGLEWVAAPVAKASVEPIRVAAHDSALRIAGLISLK